jgi:hypothetical protein
MIAAALACLPALTPNALSHAAEQKQQQEEKGDAKKNFEETKRELKRASENFEKAISEGASTLAQKIKKAFERDEKK